jgi:hypothetical protein
MARYIIQSPVTVSGVRYERGAVAELTPAQVTAIGAGNLRALSSPLSPSGAAPGTPTHDTSGEAAGVSNSA